MKQRLATATVIVASLVAGSLGALPGTGYAQGAAPVAVIQGPASADKLEAFFRGTWLVTVQGQQRTRQMVVRDGKMEGDRFVLNALYAFSDSGPSKAAGAARVENGVVALELTTGAGSTITARTTGESRLDGTFQAPTGAPLPIAIERMSTSTEWRRVSNTPTAILAPAAPVKVADLEEMLYGTWLVTVGQSGMTRNLEIRSIEESTGKLTADAVYGWTNGDPKPAPMSITVEQGIVTLDFTNSVKSRILVKSASPDRFVGTLTQADGKEFPARLMLTGNDSRPVEQEMRVKQLTLIYIGADNCGTCKRWEQTRSSKPRESKYAFLDTPEAKAVTFRQLGAANYMNTSYDQLWPEDIRWVRTKTYAASGTPRFILIADDKVMLNTRAGSLETQIMPKIRELMAKKG